MSLTKDVLITCQDCGYTASEKEFDLTDTLEQGDMMCCPECLSINLHDYETK